MTFGDHRYVDGRSRALWAFSAFAVFAALAACSGSSGDQELAPVENTPPELGGDRDVTVAENIASVAVVTASDTDGDTISYAIAGGDDAAFFQIDATSGDLNFVEAPDFEEPADADADNIYLVVISASDGKGGEDSAAYAVTVIDAPDTRYIDQIFTETTTTDDIIYATINGAEYALNIVAPVGDLERNRPVMLFATGGAFALTIPELSLPFVANFAERGYVGAVMDYRTLGQEANNATEFRFAAVDGTHDMFAAVRFLRAHADEFGIDPDRIIVGGTSAGAVMAVSAATADPDDPAIPLLADYLATTGGVYGDIGDHLDQSSLVQGAFSFSGGVFDIFTIDEKSAPIYGAHEELDTVAPCYTTQLTDSDFEISGTCDFIPYLEATGIPAQSFIVLGDDGHVDFSDDEYQQIFREAAQFFFDHVIATE